MVIKDIDIDQLNEYVYNALLDDYEIVKFYDKKCNIETPIEAVENICDKIRKFYTYSFMAGIEINGQKEGYFVWDDNILISFSISKKYRNKETLSAFWKEIKKRLGNNFHCMLYSHNIRAIEFLQRNGMKILYDEVTILCCN